jgi:hypothetical protein
MSVADFAKVAPYLGNPLTLVGFALFLFFGIHRLLIKSRIIPPIARTDAPAIIKALLRYGFWISVLVLILGFGYALLESGVTKLGQSVEKLANPSSQLALVDAYVDEGNRLNVKIRNTGNGSALIYQARLLLYTGIDAPADCCMAMSSALLSFPFEALLHGNTVNLAKTQTKEIPEELSGLEDDRYKQDEIWATRHGLDPKGFEDIHPRNSRPILLSDPLKVAEEVPAGGVEWLKIEIRDPKQHGNNRDISCCPTKYIPVRAVIYHDDRREIVTPTLTIEIHG